MRALGRKMIGIIGAMDSEINELKENIANLKTENISGINFYSGNIFGKEVVVAKSGIGKVFAAMCAQTMIIKYNLKKIIHIGIAGSLVSDLSVHEVAIASSVVQHDYDQTAFDLPKGLVQGLDDINIKCDETMVSDLVKCAEKLNINYKVGVIVSGDQFIIDTNKKQNLAKDFNAIAAEMEGASTGQVCQVNKVSFAVIRAISDGSDDSTETYKNAKQSASDVSTQVLLEYIKESM